MLKFKNLFLLGLMASVAGLFAVGCSETDDPDPEVITSEVTVVNVNGGGALVVGFDDDYLTTTFADEGDEVRLSYGIAPAGKVFSGWTSVPSNLTITRYNNSEIYKFTMPGRDVTVTANFRNVVDGEASIRFTWKAVDQDLIETIAASKTDVDYWISEVLNSADGYSAYATDIPVFTGIDDSRLDNLFPALIGAPDKNKGQYFNVDVDVFENPKGYTAVCTAFDPEVTDVEGEDNIVDIVANYAVMIDEATTSADGSDMYFEVAFDVERLLNELDPKWDVENWGVDFDIYDNPNDGPILQKAKKPPVRKLTKKTKVKGGTVEVTYYILHRTKKS